MRLGHPIHLASLAAGDIRNSYRGLGIIEGSILPETTIVPGSSMDNPALFSDSLRQTVLSFNTNCFPLSRLGEITSPQKSPRQMMSWGVYWVEAIRDANNTDWSHLDTETKHPALYMVAAALSSSCVSLLV